MNRVEFFESLCPLSQFIILEVAYNGILKEIENYSMRDLGSFGNIDIDDDALEDILDEMDAFFAETYV